MFFCPGNIFIAGINFGDVLREITAAKSSGPWKFWKHFFFIQTLFQQIEKVIQILAFITALQASNNACLVVSGSLDFLSGWDGLFCSDRQFIKPWLVVMYYWMINVL